VINKSIIFLCNFKVKVTKNAKNSDFFLRGTKNRDDAEQLQFTPSFRGLYCNNLAMVAAHGTLQKELGHKVS
jgi:hypothetical protein